MLCISTYSKGAYKGISMLCNAMLCTLSQRLSDCGSGRSKRGVQSTGLDHSLTALSWRMHMLCISACSKGAYEGISMLCNAMLCTLSESLSGAVPQPLLDPKKRPLLDHPLTAHFRVLSILGDIPYREPFKPSGSA